MRCTIFSSDNKPYHYIYLADGKEFNDLPTALQQQFPDRREVMQLDLEAVSHLAHADISIVRKRLGEQGYYLQLPPKQAIEEEITARMR